MATRLLMTESQFTFRDTILGKESITHLYGEILGGKFQLYYISDSITRCTKSVKTLECADNSKLKTEIYCGNIEDTIHYTESSITALC